MKKFQLIDEDVTKQVCSHLKSFDKFNNLVIKVEERELAQLYLSVSLDGVNLLEECLPSRDGLVGVPTRFEQQVNYLSWQVTYFNDVEKLLDAPLLVKTYKSNTVDIALGETVVDGFKYEFSLYDRSVYEEPDFNIQVAFTKVNGDLQHDSVIKTHDLHNYEDLEETFAKIQAQIQKEY